MAHATRYKHPKANFDFLFDFVADMVASETISSSTLEILDTDLVDRLNVVVDAVAFTGNGLNDATSGGTYTGTIDSVYTVTIDDDSTSPETFKWSKDGGTETTGVSITGSAQTLDTGVTITFAATTGHTDNDFWTFKATADMVGTLTNSGTTMSANLTAGSDGMDYQVIYTIVTSGGDDFFRTLDLRVRKFITE